MKLSLLAACLLIVCAFANADPETREKYTPDPKSGFPQIIQNDDYGTIDSIEALCRNLESIAAGKEDPAQFGRAVDCVIGAESIVLRARQDQAVSIRLQKGGAVQIGDALFASGSTKVFYSTLFKILNDFEKEGKCRGARFVQFAVKTYRKRCIVEFDFGEKIVLVESASNGPKEEERLYILDVVSRNDSMLSKGAK